MRELSEEKQINPVLKLALELGPLVVFFFANARGERHLHADVADEHGPTG